ncbi:hypothetical protein SASPL_112262 [Salvia splendens]|uniref:Uncharacterized protein n=1 Tax=Salvia splendens TaxID=180675 RepID=A0A8X8YAF5_SALSN|nr:hypothetical protein SASPL_112262 [Salvia splendens]
MVDVQYILQCRFCDQHFQFTSYLAHYTSSNYSNWGIMDENKMLDRFIDVEIEAEKLLLGRHEPVEIDKMRNGNREALTALRKRAKTTKTSVPSSSRRFSTSSSVFPSISEASSNTSDIILAILLTGGSAANGNSSSGFVDAIAAKGNELETTADFAAVCSHHLRDYSVDSYLAKPLPYSCACTISTSYQLVNTLNGLEKAIAGMKLQSQKTADRIEVLSAKLDDFICEFRASLASQLMTFPKLSKHSSEGPIAAVRIAEK